MEISVLNDFSEFPGLRHCNLSDLSGEEFYHQVLNPAFEKAYSANEQLIVNLDNTAGYASSFLDEAFGNLVYDFSLDVVKDKIKIVSEQEPHWKEMIEKQTFVQWEKRRKERKCPKVTKKHDAWYRIENSQLEYDIWERPAV